MDTSDLAPCFILDRTGDTTLSKGLAEESSDAEAEICVSSGQVKRAKRGKHETRLEKLVFGEDLTAKIGQGVELEEEDDKKDEEKKPAWVDEDDEILAHEALDNVVKYPKKVVPEQKYRTYLVDKFTAIHGKPKWVKKAESKNVDEDEDDSDLLGYAGKLKKESLRLEPHTLQFSKCANLTLQQGLTGVISSVQFHPSSNLALAAAVNGNLCVYQVDGDANPNLQNLRFENFSIDRARFVKSGKEIIVGSKPALGYFYTHDMIKGQTIRVPLLRAKEKLALRRFVISHDESLMASAGKNGQVFLITMDSREMLTTFKLNEEAHGLCFSKDGQKLFAHSDEGVVYVYDIRQSNRCYHRFVDGGSLGGRSLVISPNQGYLVTGDQSGLVNVYNLDSVWNTEHPKPSRSVSNLKTSIECLKFNNTSEFMAMSSGFTDNAVRTVHYPSVTVFSNFPRAYVQFKRITEVDISPNSGYLTMANNRGTAFLFNLNHYIHY